MLGKTNSSKGDAKGFFKIIITTVAAELSGQNVTLYNSADEVAGGPKAFVDDEVVFVVTAPDIYKAVSVGTDGKERKVDDIKINQEQIDSNSEATFTITGLILKAFNDPTATEKEIQAMVDAYYDGSVSLDDIKSVWAVGQSRIIHCGEDEDVAFEIIDFEHDDLADGSGKALVTLQSVDCLKTTRAMYTSSMVSSYGNLDSWSGSNGTASLTSGCKIRGWLNTTFFATLPTALNVKKVIKKTSAGYKSSIIKDSHDLVFLLSEEEMTGSRRYSFAGEGSVYAKYNGASNSTRIKKVNNVAVRWWTRSPRSTNNSSYCNVETNGSINSAVADNTIGVVPTFCL